MSMTVKNEVATNVFDVRLTDLFVNPVITVQTNSDGTRVLRVSYFAADLTSGEMLKMHKSIWPRNEILGSELDSMPFVLDDAIVRIGSWVDESGKESCGVKWLVGFAGDKQFAPAGDKREFVEKGEA